MRKKVLIMEGQENTELDQLPQDELDSLDEMAELYYYMLASELVF